MRATLCAVADCGKPRYQREWCAMHYQRWRRHGTTDLLPRQPCTVEGCENLRFGHGLCRMHYFRLQRTGSIDDPRRTLEQRFWAKVDKDGPVPMTRPELGPCWLWTGSVSSNGYSKLALGRPARHGQHISGHRLAYQLLVGPIPDGMEIDHLCVVRACVNPAHMQVVPGRINILRSRGLGARNAQKTHCPRGHEYDATNTHIDRHGGRHCRACMREKARERKQQQRQ